MSKQQWASLHSHDFFSLQDGLSSPLDNFARAVEGNLAAFCITNHGNLSSAIKTLKSRKQYISKIQSKINNSTNEEERELLNQYLERAKQLKLCLGNEMYLAVGEKENAHLVVIAKNKDGYKKLAKATSESTRRENFFRRPRLTLDQLSVYAGNLIIINGHPGSSAYRTLWLDEKASYNANTYEEARQLVHPDWKKRILAEVGKFKDIFGDNFFLESQLIDAERLPSAQVAVNIYRWVGKQLGIKLVATSDSHYPTQDRALDHRVLISNLIKVSIPKIEQKINEYDEDVGMSGFFRSENYYLPTSEEMCSLHPENEIKTSLEIAESIEEYDLTRSPIIPQFDCPNGLSSDEYMTQLCRDGWKDKLSFDNKEQKQIYADRVKKELEVLQGAGLSDYFLIVQDIMNWAKSQGIMIGPGRGSAAGCLVSYLMGITAVDSIHYNLLFERFYNSGRNAPGRISLPDIDCDVQANAREKVINYIKDKYGHKRVGQLANFGRLQGRACLKDVLRAHEACDFTMMNTICKYIPDEAAIADDLQEMAEEGKQKSIILWTLENNKKELSEWASLQDDGEIVGDFADFFKQAVRLEGTYRQIGKHAAAVVIFPDDIEDSLPVIYDKDDSLTISWDMHDVEAAGGVKFDILGITIADRIADAELAIQNEFLLEK